MVGRMSVRVMPYLSTYLPERAPPVPVSTDHGTGCLLLSSHCSSTILARGPLPTVTAYVTGERLGHSVTFSERRGHARLPTTPSTRSSRHLPSTRSSGQGHEKGRGWCTNPDLRLAVSLLGSSLEGRAVGVARAMVAVLDLAAALALTGLREASALAERCGLRRERAPGREGHAQSHYECHDQQSDALPHTLTPSRHG